MKQNIKQKENNNIEDIKINNQKIILLNKLKELLGQKVHVYIDRPLGSTHPTENSIIYKVNYGYIKEYKSLDNEYVDAYVLGIDEPIKEFEGIVYAIVIREDDIEDKLIVTPENTEYSNKEIEKQISFQEKYFKHKIINK